MITISVHLDLSDQEISGSVFHGMEFALEASRGAASSQIPKVVNFSQKGLRNKRTTKVI